MADERDQRIRRIRMMIGMLRATNEELLPPPNILKDFIRKLQHDIKDEAKELMTEGDYEEALHLLSHGVDYGGLLLLDGYSCDTTTDVKLLVLRSECANELGCHMEAWEDAREARNINPDSIPAKVAILRAYYPLASAEGMTGLLIFENILKDIPTQVKEHPDVKHIIRKLNDDLRPIRHLITTTKPNTDSGSYDADWIPSHNREIAKTNKRATGKPKEKKRGIKQISDGAEPVFPKTGLSASPSSSSQAPWVTQGAKPKRSSNSKAPERTPSVTAKLLKKTSSKVKVSAPTAVTIDQSPLKTPTSKTNERKSPAPPASSANLAALPRFHRRIKHVCGVCFTRREVFERRPGSNPSVCAGPGSHVWKKCMMVVVYSDAKKRWCKVKARHENLSSTTFPKLCTRGDVCMRNDCWFPHFKEELDLWVYMGKHKLTKLDDVVFAGRELPDLTTTAPPSSKPPREQLPPQPRDHCSYCNLSYTEPWQLEQHIQSQGHWSKVNLDEDKKDQWRYRDPPWNVVNGRYNECQEHKRGSCLFGGTPENSCTKAHSPEELEEWKERHRYRMMKMKKAKEKKLYAFMDEVLEKYNFSPSGGEDVIAEKLPGVRVECSEELAKFLDAKGTNVNSEYTCTWSFTLSLKASENKSLKRVCLFYDDNRLRFRLSQPVNESEAQVCPGNRIVEADRRTYRIDVIFHSKIFGSFSQWVLFDLGTEPYLVRKLQVRVGSAPLHGTFNDEQEKRKRTVTVWNSSNSEIVRFSEDGQQLSTSEEKLLADYEVPTSLGIDDLEELSRDNYREYMHIMLYLEEQECNNKIGKFASESKLECLDRILLQTMNATVVKNAVDGSKFGKVDLKKALMDDSETSQIIVRSVNKIMLKFSKSKRIYEAVILAEQDDLGKENQDTIHVKLSPSCVEDLQLESGTEYDVEIQLQLNRITFCYMHSAVDHLQNMDMVFPPIGNLQKLPPLDTRAPPKEDPHQQRAVKFISEHPGKRARKGAGPVLVCGPFGTGKTYTLATAVRRTLQAHKDSKILICTHSNSAADLYITEYLHKLVEAGEIGKMIRVYAKMRDIKTIEEIVRNYTKIKEGKVQTPTIKEIKASSVVVTTLTTSHRLKTSELRGHFTHILIDEAGQALETEVLQPLTLATRNTCVVLAGDHIQISPKVFSRTARHGKFHVSLLERLFYRKISRILLSSNYRTCQKMLDFISRAFYYGTSKSQQLKAVVNHEPHPRLQHPLEFFTVKGEDKKIGMSYVNNYEVDQIASIVRDLYGDWPEDRWGEMDANSICVVTPYKMQVRRIRAALRKCRLGNISVGTVQNVQGKQYRVLIISTVRTRSTLNKADTTAFVTKISPANRPDDIFDYGFLSDIRLLNTACTRAQSLLVVVGDPMALCSVGDCSKIWRRYLKECEDNGTLLPEGTTIAAIQQEMESSKQRLNPYAAAFQPAKAPTSVEPSPKPDAEADKAFPHSRDPVLQSLHPDHKVSDGDSWLQEDDKIIPDGIMRELYRQISQDSSRLKRSAEGPDVVQEEMDDADIDREVASKWKRKPPKFRMIEEGDRIVLDIHYKDRSQMDDDTVEESDSEEGLRDDKHDERERRIAYRQVEQRPDKYKICSFHCEQSGQTYAVPLDKGSSGRISITSKRRQGRALNLDEVIVEIFDGVGECEVTEGTKRYGQVICICKRAARSALTSKVVCKLDGHIDNQMVPLDRTLPKFFVLNRDHFEERKANASRASPDFSTVSIYHYRRDLQEDSPFLRNVDVSRKDRQDKLFIVEYVKWFARAPYPMGVVTEELPRAEDKETGIRILKVMHGVRDEWKPDVIKEVKEQFPDDWEIPEEEIKSRYDVRNQIIFTIDPPESQDLDDALSVELVGDNYQVGIHIADVSYFVSKDSALDTEARTRSTSFYPSFTKPINMLPPQLSNKFCSLLPNRDRLTITVLVTMDKQGNVVGDVKIVRSLIQSKVKLTYDAVEELIMSKTDGRNDNATITNKILTLNMLAKGRRNIRLGEGQFAFSHDAEEEVVQHPLAHSLVEEMMLIANQAVAIFLLKKYPDCSPLRRQLAPSEDNVEDWLDKHSRDLANSLNLRSRCLPREERNEDPADVHILKEKWNLLRSAVTTDAAQHKMTGITDLITSDGNHPRLAVAQAAFFRIQEVADYISSGDHPEHSKRRHHQLDMAAYTHFTSPIRRFFDIVVHRMLIAAINDEKARDTLHQSEKPYAKDELASISQHCNIQLLNSRGFEKKTRALKCALRLREAPQTFKVFVGGFSDSFLELIFPYRHFLPSKCPLKLLKPTSKPEFDEDNTSMQLEWKERVFELHGSTVPKPRLVQLLDLDTDQMVVKISADQWQEILAAVQAQDTDMILKAVTDADEEIQLTEQEKVRRQKQRSILENQNFPVGEITCETSDVGKPAPFVNFQRSFVRGDVVQVQLNATVQKGILTPCVQLFSLTPKLSLCAEHRGNAIESFAAVAAHRPPADIESVERYQAVWLPILKMISAYNAVVSDESCIIHDVDVDWRCTPGRHLRKFSGIFLLKQTFCTSRNFGIHAGDYVCIRYKDLPLAPTTKHIIRELDNKSTSNRSFTADQWKTTFVAHAVIAVVTDIRKHTEDWTLLVEVEVNQHSAPFPDVLLERSKKTPACTVELVPKANLTHPVIRMLLEAGRKIKTFAIQGSPFHIPNESQKTALRKALGQQFTIIQGPPGTGKTVTGAHLTYFFIEVNKQLPDFGKGPPQVLYCGPSNKSVDVVADYLLRLGVSAIRVYNNMIEQQDYPIPGQSGRTIKTKSSKETKVDPRLRSISLHHLIRNPERKRVNRHIESILDFEQKFKTPGYKITFDVVDEYRRTIHAAEEVELSKYKVVLCTCNEAGSIRIQRHVNVIQCIVDEAGMCNEPETLIPLVGTIQPKGDDEPGRPRRREVKREPRQVVLIGDHKQLRPIIQERTAVQLGMETSLIEKYGREATMLTIQYRMHESICAFPSKMFYDGKLLTADSVKKRPQQLNRTWPGGQGNPFVFCHHVGTEEKQSVRTEEGNEQSRANPQEVKHVVRIASDMVRRLRVNQDRIVIITQYRLQRALIAAELKQAGLENIPVSTVITSQGKEWDYVIMSTVRSLPEVEIDEKPSTAWKKRNLGFITDENQINVAITRPRMGLIILGNKDLLRVHITWKRLLSHYEDRNAVVDAKDFPKSA